MHIYIVAVVIVCTKLKCIYIYIYIALWEKKILHHIYWKTKVRTRQLHITSMNCNKKDYSLLLAYSAVSISLFNKNEISHFRTPCSKLFSMN